jgi:Ca2+-binding EF-hand superfamily protein
MDADHSGALDYAEFENAIRRHLRLTIKDIPAADIASIFKVLSSVSDDVLLVDTLFEFAVTQEEYLEKYRSARISYLKQEIDETKSRRKEYVLQFQGNPKMRGQLDTLSLHLESLETQLLKLKKGVGRDAPKRGVAAPRTEDIPEDVMRHIRKKIKAALYTQEKGYSIDNLKSKLGKDASGMSVRQMRSVLRRTCRLEISDAHLSLIFHTMDKDCSGYVDAEELADFAMDERSAPPARQITQATPCEVDGNEDCEQELDDPLRDAYAQDQLAEAYSAERQKTAQMLSGFIRILKQQFGCLREAFARIDTDDEHHITYNKLKECLERYQVPWQEATGGNDLRSIFRALDLNGIGLVTIGELMSALDVVQDDREELEDLTPQARHTFLRKEYRDMTCKTKFWSVRGPPADAANRKVFDKAREEDCLPTRPRDEKRTEPLDNHRMGRDGPVRQRKLEQAYQEGVEKKVELEISSVTGTPLITEKSRILAKQHEEATKGTRKGISGGAILEEVAQCSFMPQISPRSNALCRRYERGLPQRGASANDTWHMRLAEQPGINDRLDCTVRDIVEERLEGHIFAPQISAKAKKLHAKGSAPFHHRLFHGGQFTEMAKHVRAAEKDTQPKGLFP